MAWDPTTVRFICASEEMRAMLQEANSSLVAGLVRNDAAHGTKAHRR
jgi:hypothetical protein